MINQQIQSSPIICESSQDGTRRLWWEAFVEEVFQRRLKEQGSNSNWQVHEQGCVQQLTGPLGRPNVRQVSC